MNSRRYGRATHFRASAIITGLVLTLVLAWGLPAPAANDHLTVNATDDSLTAAQQPEAVKALQDSFGVSDEQATETLAFEERYSLFATQLELTYPDDYAGAWIDHQSGGVLVVAMTTPQLAIAEIPADLTQRVKVTKVDRSLAELQEMSSTLNSRINPAHGFASPDLEGNAIWIDLLPAEADSDGDHAHLAEAVDSIRRSGVTVTYRELDALPQDEGCSSTNNCSPLVAGAAINGPDSCSSGFKVVRTSTGSQGMLTAKHCDAGTYSHYIYNVLSSTGGTTSSSADVRFLASLGSLSLGDDVYSFGSLKDMSRYANPVLNGTVCRGGRNSSDCGTVDNLYVTGHRFSVENLRACPGDSGGPHYLGSTAYGTHTGSDDTTSCPGPWDETSYAVKVSHALSAMGLFFSTS